jgi:ABC-type nitrate/sulfonate/bicarbonate transport system substrate-binding protein
MRELRLGTFSPSVLVEVAAVTGALESAGLVVRELPAKSSPEQFGALLRGELDAVLTNPDNVIAYRCEPTNPLGRTADVRILAAVDGGLGLSLFAGPAYPRVADLRGGVLGVDVAGSGFAFVAFELLAGVGLSAGSDCVVQPLGATPRRASALLAGTCACTVLNAGSDLIAESRGARRIAPATSLGPYVGAVLAACGDAVDNDDDTLARLTVVLVQTSTALIEGRHRDVAVAAARRRLDLDETAADRYYSSLIDPSAGLIPDGRLSREALATSISLRNRHSPSDRRMTVDHVLGSGLIDDRLLAFLPPSR